MIFPKLYRLRKAIRNLDASYIARRIDQLEVHLSNQGQLLEPENTAITEEGIFYISPDTGMATKVVLYLADQPSSSSVPEPAVLPIGDDAKPTATNKLHEYHILKCNNLRHLEARGWKGNYKIAQRTDGTFCCRIVEKIKGKRTTTEKYHEVDNQKLYICPNCFIKVNSLLEGIQEMKRELFNLKYFFDVDFTRSWSRAEKYSREKSALEAIYPKDWLEISRIRRKQVGYHCESCEADLSHPNLRKFLYLHHSDHAKRKVSYVKLECLCIACLSELPSHAYLRKSAEFDLYQVAMGMVRFVGKSQTTITDNK